MFLLSDFSLQVFMSDICLVSVSANAGQFFFYFQKDPGFCKPSGKMLTFWLAGDLYSHRFCFSFLYFPP